MLRIEKWIEPVFPLFFLARCCLNSVSSCCSSNQRNPTWVSTPFFKHDQQIPTRFQPRAWNMVPGIEKSRHKFLNVTKVNRLIRKERMKLILPSLRGLSTVTLALLLSVGSGITTPTAASLCYISRPVASDAFAIYPHLSFPHATHV